MVANILSDAMELLIADPRTFLQLYYLRIMGGNPNRVSGEELFAISEITMNDVTKEGDPSGRQGFSVRYLGNGVPGPGERVFGANYIAMKKMTAPGSGAGPAGTFITLSANDGPDLAITSQLSGCSFGIGTQAPGGACTVSHIQPDRELTQAGMSRAAIQGHMRSQTTLLHGATADSIYEIGTATGYAEKASVVGKRVGGVWKFYGQPYSQLNRTFGNVQDL